MASALFSAITLRGLTLPNRTVVSPMCQYNSEEGCATDWHLMHLGTLSLGGFGLVMTEMTDVTPIGRITAKCAGMWSDANESAMKRVIDFCRQYGVARHGLQLGHAGRKGSTQLPAQGGKPLKPGENGGWQTEAPSPIPFGADWPAPKEMSRERISQLIGEYVGAVHRAQRIGYDLIEVHGGHGYLVHQFLSPLSNQRKDEYGGSLENRMRFPLTLFSEMRAAWPSDKPMGIRLSATDWMEGGWTPEETVVLARELKKIGCDYIDVSSGGLDPRAKIPLAPGYQVPFSQKVKQEAGITTMSVGLITEPGQAEEIIASGKADLVALARGAMWNPRFAWHAAEQLGVETAYSPKMLLCQPKMRPQAFPGRRSA